MPPRRVQIGNVESRDTEKTVHDVRVLESNPREVNAPNFSRTRRVYHTSTSNEVPVMQELHIFQVEKVLGVAQVTVRGFVSMPHWGARWTGKIF